MKIRSLGSPLAAAAVTTLLAMPAGASAAQTTQLSYQCKYPLVGLKDVDVRMQLTLPADEIRTSRGWRSFVVALGVSSHDMAGLAAIENLVELRGTTTVSTTIRPASGPTIPATIKGTLLDASVPYPIPEPVFFASSGDGPDFFIPAPGPASVTLDAFSMNLTAVDAAGAPIVLPPLTTDVDGNTVSDSDGDPGTFDVYCKLDPADQDLTLARTTVIADGQPDPTPEPTATLDPTPTPVRTPTPTPGDATPAVPRDATNAPFQCRWPLLGNSAVDIYAARRDDVVTPGGNPLIGIWLITDLNSGLSPVPDQTENTRGTIDVTLSGGGGAVRKTATVTAVKRSPYPYYDRVVFYASTLLQPGDLPAPVGDVRVTTAAPNLIAYDETGTVIQLPKLTRDIDGNPATDSDGNPDTFDVSCKPGALATPTPTTTPTVPTPTATPYNGPTPPTPSPTPPPTPVTAKYAYTLQGSTTLNTLTKGSMPLTGSVDASLVLTTGDVTADLQLNDTQGRLVALGFLPVTATVGFVPSGPTTGKLVDDQLTTNSKVRIKVKSVKAFGAIPLAGGNNCQSKQLSDITLKSTDSFDPTGTGGALAGTYAISDLNGCGPLNGLVSPLTSGGGNTISVKLTPKPTA